MGFWERFEKREHVSFVKDAEGTVHANRLPSRPQPKTSRQLEQEYREQQKQQRIERISKPVVKQPSIGMFDPRRRSDVITVKRPSQIPRKRVLQPFQPVRNIRRNDYNPFGTMFDTGMPRRSSKKKKKYKDPFSGFNPLGNNWRM